MTEEIVSQLLDLVRAADPSAEAEVVVEVAESALTRFANSYIHQNIAESSTWARLRLHADGRTASGATTITDGDGLRALVERTIAAARLCPPDPQWPGLSTPADVLPAAPVDPAIVDADPAARAERVRDFAAAAAPLATAGYCYTGRWDVTFANTAGQQARAQSAQAAMDAIARAGTVDGVARLGTPRLADLDGALLGHRAATKVLTGADPEELPPGRYEVVLEPSAVIDILQNMALFGFNGKAVNERRSFVEVGAHQFDPAITIADDPFAAASPGLPFDVEGTPKRRLLLVEHGLSAAIPQDRRTAMANETTSTGHAITGAGPFGPVPLNVGLLGSAPDGPAPTEVAGPAADSSVAVLIANVARGLLVSDFWYTRVLDPRTLVVTGLTRNGVWLIEDGVITRPVKNMRFTQSYPQALAEGAVRGVGTHSFAAFPSSDEPLQYLAPALHLSSWNFTGNASG
jgi:predicted Zn-dependent protease